MECCLTPWEVPCQMSNCDAGMRSRGHDGALWADNAAAARAQRMVLTLVWKTWMSREIACSSRARRCRVRRCCWPSARSAARQGGRARGRPLQRATRPSRTRYAVPSAYAVLSRDSLTYSFVGCVCCWHVCVNILRYTIKSPVSQLMRSQYWAPREPRRMPYAGFCRDCSRHLWCLCAEGGGEMLNVEKQH